MDNEPGSNPAGEALRAELADITGNPQNPLHAGFHRGDQAVLKQIDAKYTKIYGTGDVPISGGLVFKAGGPEPPQADSPDKDAGGAPEDAGLPLEDAAKFTTAVEQLQRDWGQDFEPRATTLRANLESLDRQLGKDLTDDLLGAYLGVGGDPVTLYKAVEALGRSAGH